MSTLTWQPVYEKENFDSKPVKLRFKIGLVSHLAQVEWSVNIYVYVLDIQSKDFFFQIMFHFLISDLKEFHQ